MRLPAMVPFALVGFVGCVVTAVGFQYGWPWETIVVVGFGFIGVHVAGLAGIVMNYVVSENPPPVACVSFTRLISSLTFLPNLPDRLLQACSRRVPCLRYGC